MRSLLNAFKCALQITISLLTGCQTPSRHVEKDTATFNRIADPEPTQVRSQTCRQEHQLFGWGQCERLLRYILSFCISHSFRMTKCRWWRAQRAADTAISSAASSGRCWLTWRQTAPRATTSTCTASRRSAPGTRRFWQSCESAACRRMRFSCCIAVPYRTVQTIVAFLHHRIRGHTGAAPLPCVVYHDVLPRSFQGRPRQQPVNTWMLSGNCKPGVRGKIYGKHNIIRQPVARYRSLLPTSHTQCDAAVASPAFADKLCQGLLSSCSPSAGLAGGQLHVVQAQLGVCAAAGQPLRPRPRYRQHLHQHAGP